MPEIPGRRGMRTIRTFGKCDVLALVKRQHVHRRPKPRELREQTLHRDRRAALGVERLGSEQQDLHSLPAGLTRNALVRARLPAPVSSGTRGSPRASWRSGGSAASCPPATAARAVRAPRGGPGRAARSDCRSSRRISRASGCEARAAASPAYTESPAQARNASVANTAPLPYVRLNVSTTGSPDGQPQVAEVRQPGHASTRAARMLPLRARHRLTVGTLVELERHQRDERRTIEQRQRGQQATGRSRAPSPPHAATPTPARGRRRPASRAAGTVV